MNDKRMTEVSRKWSSSGVNLDAAESEARRLEKKGTFAATMDEEAGTVTLSKDDFKSVMGKLGTHKRTAKTAKKNVLLLAFGYLAVTIGFIAVIVGLVNWRLEATKEAHVTDSQLVGRDGTIVETGDVVSYTQLFDLPYFDMSTISKVKDVIITLMDGRQFALSITRASKSAGSTRLQLEDANGNGLDIDSCSLMALAKIDGNIFPLKGMASEIRKLAGSSSPALYSASEFAALKSEQRQLGVGSADIGTIALALRSTEAVLDAAEGFHAPKDWESAYIESEGLTIMVDVPVVNTRVQTFAERLDGETNYIVGAWNGAWYMYMDTLSDQIRHYKYDTGRTICLPADEKLNEMITLDKTLTTPVVKDCNEDGYIYRENTNRGVTITRITSIEYDSLAILGMKNIRVIVPFECNLDMLQRDYHNKKIYNMTLPEDDYDPDLEVECSHEAYMRGESCEDPIGFTEAVEAGRNLEEDIAAYDNAVMSRDEGRNLWLRDDEIRGGGVKHKSKHRHRLTNVDKGDLGGSNADTADIRNGDPGVGKAYVPRPLQPFQYHMECGGYGTHAAWSRYNLDSPYGVSQPWSLRQLFVANPSGYAGNGRYLQEQWYCDILKRYQGAREWLNEENIRRRIRTGYQGRLDEWEEIFSNGPRQFMDHGDFDQVQELWLTHIPACMSGRMKPSDCGGIGIGGAGADLIGYGSAPNWRNWAECMAWGSRGGICYSYPVIVLMFAGMGWTPRTRGLVAKALHALWDAFLAAFLGQIPFPYRGTPTRGGLKIHTGGTVLYVWFIEGCMGHHLLYVHNKWGRVSYNVGMSLGNAAVVIFTQWKPAKFGTVVWGGYPTCFDPEPANLYAIANYQINNQGNEDYTKPNHVDFEGEYYSVEGDYGTVVGMLMNGLGQAKNTLGVRAMDYINDQFRQGLLSSFAYQCGDVRGRRYATSWDSITGGGEVTSQVFKLFRHDVDKAYRAALNCKYAANGSYNGNNFALWAAGAISQGIIGNIIILAINRIILPLIEAFCPDRVAKWWGWDCTFPDIPYINPFEWCRPDIMPSGTNYSGGGLFEGHRWNHSNDDYTNRPYAEARGLSNTDTGDFSQAMNWFTDRFLQGRHAWRSIEMLHNVIYFSLLDIISDAVQFKVFHQGNWYNKAHHNEGSHNRSWDRFWDGDNDENWWGGSFR